MLIGGVGFGSGLAAVWVAPAVIAVIALLATRWSPAGRRRRTAYVVTALTMAYVLGVILITLYPFTFDIEPGRILDSGNWVPFGGTLGFVTSDNALQVAVGRRDFFANIALFAPLGLLLGARARRIDYVLGVGAVLIGLAFALEVVQGLTVAERTLDIDDAIVGSAGAFGGVVIGALSTLGTARTRGSRYS